MGLRTFFAFLFFLVFAFSAGAQLSVPSYSFTGKEITNFSVKPSYTSVDFRFEIPSKMDTYLQKRNEEFASADRKDYNADEPSAIYSSGVGTSLSAVFVGKEAFRNNVVKMFLNKSYIDVIASFEKYEKKLNKSKFLSETKLLYGISLYETGNRADAIKTLTEVAKSEDTEFAEIAQDALFGYLANAKNYSAIEAIVPELQSNSANATLIWLKYLYSKDRYEDVLQLLDKSELERSYPELRGLRMASLYFLQRYKEAANLVSSVKSPRMRALGIDALIMSNNLQRAETLLGELPAGDSREILSAKLNIGRGNFSEAAQNVKNIKDEQEKMSLFFYIVSSKFKDVPADFLRSFAFKDKMNNDYVNFYSGMKYLSAKRYPEAVMSFNLVTFNKDLINASMFYQGMANIYLDTTRAEWNFLKYIGSGGDSEKVLLSKFMLSQLYFFKNSYEDALTLIDDCSLDYCSRLKADIYLAQGKYDKALKMADGLSDERASLIRATVYYNKKDYEKALAELRKVKTKSSDADYLLMMCYFKLKRFDEAEKIFKANLGDINIFTSGVEQLILAGKSQEALAYLDRAVALSPAMKIEKGKLLMNVGRDAEARATFESALLDKNLKGEAYLGLFELAKKQNRLKEFLSGNMRQIEDSEGFAGKDMLVALFASAAIDINEPNIAIGYVNYFITVFQDSPYLADVYKTRIRLYMLTGRFENCISDADRIIASSGETAEDALFLKAECLERVNKGSALEIYRAMAKDSKRFGTLAETKLALISDSPQEVLDASLALKDNAGDVYSSGVLRFFDMSDASVFLDNKELVENLAASSDNVLKASAIRRIARDYAENKQHDKAAQYYMKAYYLFPNDKFAKDNLVAAKRAYEARDMKKEADALAAIISKLDGDKIGATNKAAQATQQTTSEQAPIVKPAPIAPAPAVQPKAAISAPVAAKKAAEPSKAKPEATKKPQAKKNVKKEVKK